MADHRRINSKYYYDLLPAPEHHCGDIWSGIGSLGLLGAAPLSGIVVTPACDLEQKKTETVTFLPIIPLRHYFSTTAALPEVRRTIDASLRGSQIDFDFHWTEYAFRPPPLQSIAAAHSAIEAYLKTAQRGQKEHTALERAKAGLRIATAIGRPELSDIPSADLATAFTDWDKKKDRLIRNGYSSDLHFLPSDDQDLTFSGLALHSLVMFRYPITVPIEVLDFARESNEANWPSTVDTNLQRLPMLAHFRSRLPIKTLRLKSEFLSDLLSRYVMIYNRIGSPDFTPASVARFSSEVDL